jgi:hypothetical protein
MTNHLETTVLQDLASVNENYKEEGEKVRGESDTHTHAHTHGGTLPDYMVFHT